MSGIMRYRGTDRYGVGHTGASDGKVSAYEYAHDLARRGIRSAVITDHHGCYVGGIGPCECGSPSWKHSHPWGER